MVTCSLLSDLFQQVSYRSLLPPPLMEVAVRGGSFQSYAKPPTDLLFHLTGSLVQSMPL